jgi:hypothetical protein
MATKVKKKSRKAVVVAGPGARKRAKPTSRAKAQPAPKAAVMAAAKAATKAAAKPARRAPAVRQASSSERSYAIKP